MPDLLKHTQVFFQKYSSSELYIACSGGVDSMVLLYLASKAHQNVHAIHVNYQLRGRDSDLDEKLVSDFCSKNKIPIHIKNIDLGQILKDKKANLQDLARKVRYDFFNELTESKNAFVALAQHSDDQVETFFLNLARGGGIAGLASIYEERGKFLRPLLSYSKDEIKSFAVENNIEWREDKSNAESKYNRNKLRNIILPELQKEIPSLKESIITLTRVFQSTQIALEVEIRPLVYQIQEEGILSVDQLDKLDESKFVELLRQLEISIGILDEIRKLEHVQKGKFIELKHPLYSSIIKENDHLFFSKKSSVENEKKLLIEEVLELPVEFNKDEIYINPDKIKGDLVLRKWKSGDRIAPIGIRGTKLVSDILTDAKVPNHMRSEQLVVHDDSNIIWCVGHSVSRIALANKSTRVLKLSVA